ncbi:MAG TPA: MBL fold metallo-hydrolase [Candidatus Acidoferrales bacterium]|nr:MBL fold metallo-hydrolase [Candidatus Acidoferrales bacterium]
MYFEQFYLSCLAHASYMIGSEGVAAVVDPQRDVEIYIEEAAKQGLRIAHIIETHLHADFVSGHRELAARTGSTIHIGAKADAGFPHHPAKDGDEIRFGKAVLRFLETPGHTLESMCVLVTDLERAKEPWAVLTGDTLFIGDVGRPDLSPEHTPQQLAGLLYDSLHKKLLSLPDAVEVYPAHGAGSLCGRNISPERRSTIGKERQFNYALRPMNRDEFVHMLTSDLPVRPEYFRLDAEINRQGAEALEKLPELKVLPPNEVLAQQESGAVVLDTRPTAEYSACHVPGALHIALSGQYASWAAILLGLDSKIILVAEDPERLRESQMRLARVGIEKVAGYLDGGMLAWEKAGLQAAQVPEISVLDLARAIEEQNGNLQVIDVRKNAEWEAGHIEQACLKPLDQLRKLLGDLDRARPIAVHCKSGYRSSIATSLLEAAGFQNLMNVTGGFDAWLAQNLPSVQTQASCART